MTEPPINKLDYAPQARDQRPTISPLRLGVACTIWGFPFAFVLIMSSMPATPLVGLVLVILEIPFVIACGMAGAALLHGRRGYLATFLMLFLLLYITGWRVIAFIRRIDFDFD
jgi:hypothetical protein